MASDSALTPGFYGKLPELGDFVNRRMPRSFLDPWDEWLQNCIASSRQQLGEAWLNLYLNSPIWRFVLSGGLCGEVPWAGVLMPSVDRVGRYFPLIIAQRLPLDTSLFQVAVDGARWFDETESVILTALEEQDFDLELFDRKVESLISLHELAKAGASSVHAGYGSAWRIPVDEDVRLQGILHRLAHQLVQQRLGAYSLWWSVGSDSVTPSLLVCADLPPIHDFGALLSGDWENSAWEQWCLPAGTADESFETVPEGPDA